MDHYYRYQPLDDTIPLKHAVVQLPITNKAEGDLKDIPGPQLVAMFKTQDDAVAFVQRKNNGV